METVCSVAKRTIGMASAGAMILLVLVLLISSNQPKVMAQATTNPPVGSVMAWAGPTNSIPSNYFVCDGRELDRTQFPALFNATGTTWGGTAVNKFKIPDLRGLFLRGVDGGSGRDPDSGSRLPAGTSPANDVGSSQTDMIQAHKHNDTGHGHGATTTGNVPNIPSTFNEDVDNGSGAKVNGNEGGQGSFSPDISATTTITNGSAQLTNPVESTAGVPRIGKETRPKNAYVYWIIRVK